MLGTAAIVTAELLVIDIWANALTKPSINHDGPMATQDDSGVTSQG
jgi:hypothetical protein